MSDQYMSGSPMGNAPTGAPQDGVSVLQNVARQIGQYAQSIVNAYPIPTTTASPAAIGFNNISTVATTVLSTSAVRHGLIFHNPGTANIYVFPSAISTTPTTTILGGSILIYPGGTFNMPSSLYPNVNCGWSALSGTGSAQALTILEFF